MSNNSNPFKQLVNARSNASVNVDSSDNQEEAKAARPEATTTTKSADPPSNQVNSANKQKGETKPGRKRGRPATGKRSDPGWLGRTYYVKQETDLDVEEELLNLKRQGIEIDKSELVDGLLAAWVKWRNGEQANVLLGKISPRRK